MISRPVAALGAVLVLVAACGGGGDGPGGETMSDPTSTPAIPAEPVVPDGPTMQGWVETVVDFGVRRPGYGADDEVSDWIAEQFETAGLDGVALEPVQVNRWTPDVCRLTWWSDAAPGEATRIDCFALPYSNPDVDLTATIVLDDGGADISGALAVVRNEFREVPQSFFAAEALDVVAPDEFIETDSQPIPFGFRNGELLGDFFVSTESRGGTGLIGVLDGLGTDRYYAPYTGEDRELPAAWLAEAAGEQLLAAAAAGPVTARLEVTAGREPVESANVVGVLPGAGDSWVVIGTHHDAPWASAVEDATGIAMVLAQAHHWAGIPESERPHNLAFVATAGHMAGAAGAVGFVADHADMLDATVLEVHLEHLGLRASHSEEGLVVSGGSEVRWWFTTDRADLRTLVTDALRAEGLERDLVVPAAGFFGAEGPLSDAAPFFWADVPIVSLISAPLYLFDSRDTIDKVDVAGMVDVTAATTRMIEGTGALSTTRPSEG